MSFFHYLGDILWQRANDDLSVMALSHQLAQLEEFLQTHTDEGILIQLNIIINGNKEKRSSNRSQPRTVEQFNANARPKSSPFGISRSQRSFLRYPRMYIHNK
jgi:hypothetical protein